MDPDRARQLLTGERARLERALGRLQHEDSGEPSQADPASLASDTYQAEYDETLADELRAQLAAIERAEARLAEGTYGLSVVSGEPIPDDRLQAFPAAERTVDEEES